MNRRLTLLAGVLLGCLWPLAISAQFEIKGGNANLLDQRRAGASATIAGGQVNAIAVRNPGGGYTAAPAIVITAPDSGVTATAVATLEAGRVLSITITNPGSGYTSIPSVFLSPPRPATGNATTTPQFAGAATTSATSGAIATGSTAAARYPRASDLSIPGVPVVTAILARSTFGNSFASGVPLYFMGDEILRPTVTAAGLPVDPNYWRARPVDAGELFDGVALGNLEGATQPLLPNGSVTVASASVDSANVQISGGTSGLVPGAVLLGQRVNRINGTAVTLAGPANRTITVPEAVTFSPYVPYYFSPHASRVFASQPGRVTITWVSAAPDTSNEGESTPTYKFRRETFAVSSASRRPARVIYWTEKGFTGPIVSIPSGRIVRVNPVFNSFVPGMTTEYVPVGSNPNPSTGVAPAPEPRTLWFDDQNGPPSLHAYNIEGRVMIEYLGAELQGATGRHQFLGADILDIRRVAEVATITTPLGERLRPRQEAPANGDDELVPSILYTLNQGQRLPYGSHIRASGNTDYHAERESLDADRITIYWLEPSDAAIHFLAAPEAPGLNILWPKFKRNYVQVWPEALADYEPLNVTDSGNNIAIGPRFAATSLPQVIFQDDPAEAESEIDAGTQRLVVRFSPTGDRTNRSLLKFSSTQGPWYVRLYIQSQDLLGSPEVPDPDGEGPLNGAAAVATINDRDADGEPDLALQATVGTRLEPPSSQYALAGHVARGRNYAENLYLEPFAVGVKPAASGAIIPVNALPEDDELLVWWFKEIVPPSDKFESFHVPAVAARYQVSYPAAPQTIVIASGKGVENPALTSIQSSGTLYVQNDPAKLGYNPNEEHALLLAGNAYALRDDLNTATSSQPLVLIQYTDTATATTPARPAMRALGVVRSTSAYPLEYDKIAGTPAQPPLPLTALPLPLLANGTVRNTEEPGELDEAPASDAPASYDAFTFIDRKGIHWIYRGPHDGGTPSFGMRFYYVLREGFAFPSLDQPPAVGSIQPFIADTGAGEAVTLTYLPKWPDDPSLPATERKVVPVLYTAQTLGKQLDGLPQVLGQSSAQVIYQQSIALDGIAKPAVGLHDPIRAKTVRLDAPGVGLARIPASILTSEYAGKTYFQKLPPHLQQRFTYDPNDGEAGSLSLVGEYVDVPVGLDFFHLNQLGETDLAELRALCPDSDGANKAAWNAAIARLSTVIETFVESTEVPGTWVPDPTKNVPVAIGARADITSPDQAVVDYALGSTGLGNGYVTLAFGNGRAFTDEGDPVALQIIKVVPELYAGDLKVLLASNPLDEQVILRHSGDYAGEPANFEFSWRYGFAESGLPPALTDPATDPLWINPGGTLRGSILVGGSPTAVISTPAVLMGDVWFTMRYRLAAAGEEPAGAWSDWLEPVSVEGWIKRVLARITPFNQRMENLYDATLNTDVSLLTQAGTRWEGDIALNLENINEAGLIEIYETVLNRGKAFTIGSGIDFGPSNQALILAAGYLHDLYVILGNEAYADAANPTISIDDQDTVTEVNTSRFSFEGQVASSLDEELGLLRGRDDFGLPSSALAPAYNRLWWNYTRGIDSGEALYAVNYNIREKAGSNAANGTVDAADAQLMFPQGHGDAYGHYLTSIKGYYKLLTHPEFTWIPSAEAVNLLGQAVLVDYKDERKFAASAGLLARSALQVVELVQRQAWEDDPEQGWSHLRDGKVNPRTLVTRHQGLDEWVSRSAQGTFYHWVVANSMLPDVDLNPSHTGVQVIDRTRVPELAELTVAIERVQSAADASNARLNPLGLAPGAIAFDISPALHQAGESHYEQVRGRALRTLLNARGSFDQAARMTRLLRNQENQVAERQMLIEDEEDAFTNRLVEIYGRPYPGDIGPGKTYVQGYVGPDLFNWFVIDRPTNLVDTTQPVTVQLRVPTGVNYATLSTLTSSLEDPAAVDTWFASLYGNSTSTVRTLRIMPDRHAQYADVIGGLGTRPATGALQEALVSSHLARLALLDANRELQLLQARFASEGRVLHALVKGHVEWLDTQESYRIGISTAQAAAAVLGNVGESLQWAGEAARDAADAAQEALPTAVGFSTDVPAPARGAIKFAGFGVGQGFVFGGLAARAAGSILEATVGGLTLEMESVLEAIGFDQDELQAAYEFEMLGGELAMQHHRFAQLATELQMADEQVRNLIAEGQSVLLDRESFKQRAAAVITGFRTRDLTFRTFRNEALEQYRSLFDLAARYSYLAAKSYDYETGLLGSPEGRAVINRLVASRSLGDLSEDVPQATTSTLGDAGLAGTLAQLDADFSVAEGRLGINNPDPYGTLFSLRHELFRILDDPASTADDAAWQQVLEQAIVPDLLGDPDAALYCSQLRRADGAPVPGIILSFGSTIEQGLNFFGLPLAAGDHAYSSSSFATKIGSAGILLKGYVGMDPYVNGSSVAGGPATSGANALSATPYVYLIPAGADRMRAPALGDSGVIRSWQVADQALPLPYNLGASAFNDTQFLTANGTLSERPWITRKHQAFRPVADAAFFYGSMPTEFTNRRLIGRSAWNARWKIIIPAYTLLNDEQEGLDRFVASVKDVQLFLRTYSHAGN